MRYIPGVPISLYLIRLKDNPVKLNLRRVAAGHRTMLGVDLSPARRYINCQRHFMSPQSRRLVPMVDHAIYRFRRYSKCCLFIKHEEVKVRHSREGPYRIVTMFPSDLSG